LRALTTVLEFNLGGAMKQTEGSGNPPDYGPSDLTASPSGLAGRQFK